MKVPIGGPDHNPGCWITTLGHDHNVAPCTNNAMDMIRESMYDHAQMAFGDDHSIDYDIILRHIMTDHLNPIALLMQGMEAIDTHVTQEAGRYMLACYDRNSKRN